MQQGNSEITKRVEKKQLLYEKLLSKNYYIMKLSATLINRLISFLPSQLIVLTGVSCSGKSAIASELAKKDPSIVHIDVDLIARKTCLEIIRESYPDLYDKFYPILRNTLAYYIFYCEPKEIFSVINMVDIESIVTLKQLFLKNTAALIKLRNSITEKLIIEVKVKLILGKTVILDLVADSKVLEPFAEFEPLVMTIYTPIKQLLKQMHNRNENAIIKNSPFNYRKSDVVLSQLSKFFSINVDPPSVPVLEKVSYKYLSDILRQYLKNDKGMGLLGNQVSENFVDDLISKWNIDKHKLNYLCCREKTDVLIHIGDMEPDETAKLLFSYLTHQNLYQKILPKFHYNVINATCLQPRLIILDGLSTAGKTTTAEAFIRLNASTVLLRRSARQRKLLQQTMPLQARKMNKYGDTLFSYAKYKGNKSFEESFPVMQTINKKYIEEVNEHAVQKKDEILLNEELSAAKKAKKYIDAGITVILDNLIFKDNLSHFQTLSPLIVLVYCPFADILKHILSRNKEAVECNIPSKWRDPYKVFQDYTNLYGPIDKLNYGDHLEVLTKSTVLNVLETMFSTYPEEKFDINREKYTKDLLNKLGLNEQDSVNIYPQLTFPHLVLNTAKDVNHNAASLLSLITKSKVADTCSTALNI